jgi:hypothetical protein
MSAVEHAYLEARAHNVHAPSSAPKPEPPAAGPEPNRRWWGRSRAAEAPAVEGTDLDLTAAERAEAAAAWSARDDVVDLASAERAEQSGHSGDADRAERATGS